MKLSLGKESQWRETVILVLSVLTILLCFSPQKMEFILPKSKLILAK